MSHRQRSRRRSACVQAVQSLEPRRLMSYSVVANSAVVMNTSLGEVVVQLYSDMPITTSNFLSYVAAGTYNGTVFHRTTSNGDSNGDTFGIVQGGGFTDTNGVLTTVKTEPPIVDEATTAHPNSVGTIGMARTSSADSATTQFFFNTTDNSSIFDPTSSSAGYAAFGTVVRGLGIVDTINNLNNTTSVTASDGETLQPPETNTGAFVTINSATEEDTMTATMGPSDASGTRTISFFDTADGAGTTVSLSGAESTLTFTGTNLSAKQVGGNLKVSGTNLQLDSIAATTTGDSSNLTFSSPGRNKHVDLGDVTITGSLNSITGSGINLTGDIAITGSVKNIQLLASNAAGFISIDTDQVTNAPATTINIPFLSDISIQSGAPIKELITRSYIVDDGTSRGVTSNGAITTVKDYGPMEAAVDGASIGTYQATEVSAFVESSGTIGKVTVDEFQGGGVYSAAAYSAKTLGIKYVHVLGALNQAEILATGNIGTIKAASMTETTIYAGIDPSTDLSQTGGFASQFTNKATLQNVTLKTPKGNKATSFSTSQIGAFQIDSLNLGRVSTTLSNGGTFSAMGIQTNDLKSLVATSDKHQSLDFSDITTQAQLDTDVSKRKLTLGDFTFDIL